MFLRRIVRWRLMKIHNRKLQFSHFWILGLRSKNVKFNRRVLDPSQSCFLNFIRHNNRSEKRRHMIRITQIRLQKKTKVEESGGGGITFNHFLPLRWSNLKRACKVEFLMKLTFIQRTKEKSFVGPIRNDRLVLISFGSNVSLNHERVTQ